MFFVGHVWQAGCVPLFGFLSHCWWFHVHVGCLHMLTLPLRSFVRFPFLLVNFLARFPKVGCEKNTSRSCLVAILMAKSQCLLLNGPVMLKIPLALHPWPGTCVLSFWVDIWPADPAWGLFVFKSWGYDQPKSLDCGFALPKTWGFHRGFPLKGCMEQGRRFGIVPEFRWWSSP